MSKELDLELLAQVIDLIAEAELAPRSAMEPHSTLQDDLGIDYHSRVVIAMECETAFDVFIVQGDEDGWETIADVVRSVQSCIESQRA